METSTNTRFKISARLEVLEARREYLIMLNRRNNYSTVLAPEKKQKQYHKLLLEIRNQKAELYMEKRKDANYLKNLNKAHQNTLQILSKPVLVKSLTPVI